MKCPEQWKELEELDSVDLMDCDYPQVDAVLDGLVLSAECPHCGQIDAYVSTGEHSPMGEDVVHCTGCDKIFKIQWR